MVLNFSVMNFFSFSPCIPVAYDFIIGFIFWIKDFVISVGEWVLLVGLLPDNFVCLNGLCS